MSEEVSGVLSVPNKPSGFCGRKAVFTYLLTSPAAPAGIGTRNPSLASPALYQQAIPASMTVAYFDHNKGRNRPYCDVARTVTTKRAGAGYIAEYFDNRSKSFQWLI